MQFLHEEFFGKTYKFIKNINVLPIRIIMKLFFWGFILGGLAVLAWLFAVGKRRLFFWIIGILFVAELAHILRKSRERKMNMKAEESSNIQDQLAEADVIKKEKKKVSKKSKNEELLKKSVKVKITKEKTVNRAGLLKGK